LKQRDDETVRM